MQYQQFPRSRGITKELLEVVHAFEKVEQKISSAKNTLSSNEVLACLCPHLTKIGYQVETGKTADKKIDVPVLFGRDNHIDKSFFADALSADGRIVIEVEAGQATENHRFLKDIFEASMASLPMIHFHALSPGCLFDMDQTRTAQNLIKYLIGRKPFYKLIKNDRDNTSVLKVFNFMPGQGMAGRFPHPQRIDKY